MKSSRETVEKRQLDILDYIRTHQSAGVNAMAAYFHVTPATIRRDLNALEQKKCVSRYFGGAKSSASPSTRDIPPTDIGDAKETVRRRIAKAAADMIEDGDTVFMNSSSTASLVLEYLGDKSVTVITNNARAILFDRGPRTQLILTGGEVYGRKQSLVGNFAGASISKVTAAKCILGISGISASEGITSLILQETAINQAMLRRCSGKKIIVAEGSKIGVSHSFNSGSIHDITHLVTDSTAAASCLEEIRSGGVTVLTVC